MTLTVNPPVILQRAPNSQIRVQLTMFNGEQRLDIREFRPLNGTEFKPTKHGVTVPLHIAAPFSKAVAKLAAELPSQVIHIEDRTGWVIARTREDAQFHKRGIFDSEQTARGKSPPDGFNLYKILVHDNAVTKTRRIAHREDGAWKNTK